MLTPFESINLAASVLQFPPAPHVALAPVESSDDGLDPTDFLTHTVPDLPRPLLPSPHHSGLLLPSATPDLLRGVFSSSTTPLALSGEDSLYFSFSYLRAKSSADSPVEHLLDRHRALEHEMLVLARRHKQCLSDGEDCSGVRTAISKLYSFLSENCLLLQELYTREIADADTAVTNFKRWDRKRSRVLRRVQEIKSDNNEYGAKLGDLLTRRSDIDAEIATLESRLTALQASKASVNTEIDSTMSVLESKAAKYVETFRNLERTGRDAIVDYLHTSGMPELNVSTLLKFEPVVTSFVHTKSESSEAFKPSSNHILRDENIDEPKSQATIGMQAFEIPLLDGAPSLRSRRSSAYQQGYAKGSEQLERVKKGVATFVQSVFQNLQPPSAAPYRKLDDSLNTITEQINVKPMLELLLAQSEALEDLKFKTSRTLELFHAQSTLWSDLCQYIDAQETALQKVLSRSERPDAAKDVLEEVHNYLLNALTQHGELKGDETNFLLILIKQEIETFTTALDQITGSTAYSLSLLKLEAFAKPPSTKSDLRYSITSMSSQYYHAKDLAEKLLQDAKANTPSQHMIRKGTVTPKNTKGE